MSPPRRPNLFAVDGGRKDNPTEHPYRTAFIMSLITGAGAVMATLAVQAVFNRAARRGRQEEFLALQQQQQPMFSAFPPMMPAGPMPMQGGGYVFVQQPGMGMMPMPVMQQQPPQQGFPQALTYQTKSSRRAPPPANDTPPEWFASFVKKQDSRFRKLEAQLAEDEEYEEDEAG